MTRLRLFIVAVAYTLLAVLTAVPAAANEDLAPETQGLDSREAFRTGTLFSMKRRFRAACISSGATAGVTTQTKAGTGRTSITPGASERGFCLRIRGRLARFDFGVFGSHDLMNKGAVDHEMGF
ncbi:MAG: hypothetical protein ACLSAH_13085 [Bilophila wadsworthia]